MAKIEARKSFVHHHLKLVRMEVAFMGQRCLHDAHIWYTCRACMRWRTQAALQSP